MAADTLTAGQAAQRLLTLLEVLGLQADTAGTKRPHSRAGTGNAQKTSVASISWAFHDSTDKDGFLRWLADNADAGRNGVVDSELELFEYLERIGYHDPQAQSKQTSASGDVDSTLAETSTPMFELRDQRAKLQKKVASYEKHSATIRQQNEVLSSRVDTMARELAELKAEEEALEKSAAALDAELARLVSVHSGQLEEALLATRLLVRQLEVNGKAAPNDAPRYHYQCNDAIKRLCLGMQSYFDSVGRQIEKHAAQVSELPSPWKEFEPYAARNVPELLQTAQDEHRRISDDVSSLVRSKLALEVEAMLVHAISSEIDRLDNSSLLEYHQEASLVTRSNSLIEQVIRERSQVLAESPLAAVHGSSVPEDIAQAIDTLNDSCSQLAHSQTGQVGNRIDSVLQSLASQTQVIENALQSLVDEKDMLDGWTRLWSVVSASLDEDNAKLEKQKIDLEHGATKADPKHTVISPDDVLALSLKRLISMSRTANRAAVVLSDAGSQHAVGSQRNGPSAASLLQPMLRLQSDDEALDSMLVDAEATSSQQPRRRESWLSEDAAFTGWDMLLADARDCLTLVNNSRDAVDSCAKTAKSIARNMDRSLANINAALHGGSLHSGSEAVDILPLDVRDSLGELKYQAGVQRKRVTRATMLSEEPSKAAASDAAALFCEFF
ncbi:hypothetical protein GGI15_001130 [Coemansia interrupta]|uniref:Uncharacterized protein n=1 Tax=Coemansia interrupta TaxID=1126814 RepID=A0A9W8LP63_9FUNG|nr:hypothetical protein GGI15_001130 [Coemansia interrupta]